jgi:hypothetical protein
MAMKSGGEKKGGEERPAAKGQMTVEEAGHLGGKKGGQRVKELIEEGKEKEAEDKGR